MDSLIRNILAARVYDVAVNTPLDLLDLLSKQFQTNIWLKREDLQPIFSFKIRGAYNCIFQLTKEERSHGVICASAGNHAQGVALSGRHLGLPTTIVMPTSTPTLKVNACRELGASVILYGETFDDAYDYALTLANKEQQSFIHPFDDIDVIAGQGTIGKELLEQQPDLDIVFVPVGGGGLISGIATYIKNVRPECIIIGVEPEDSASMLASLEQKERVVLSQVGTFADGTSVKQVGKLAFSLCQQYVDEIITVTTDEISAAMKDIFNNTRAISEPSGALAVAGIKKYLHRNPTHTFKNIGGILSGANVNFERIRYAAERAELGEKTETLLAVTIPERPGSFRNFIDKIGKRSITEFNYRYADEADAVVFAGIQLTGADEEKASIIAELQASGFSVIDLSDNEMAITHIRHMVGGKANHIQDERLFSFVFPERPGALLQFLSVMGSQWNISLFHYRNHGSDYGRVLVGIQVPDDEENSREFEDFLSRLGYEYTEETDNPAYHLFL